MENLSIERAAHISPPAVSLTGSGDYIVIGSASPLEEIQKKNFESIFNTGKLFAPMVFNFKGEHDYYQWFDMGMLGMVFAQSPYINTLYKTTLVQQAHDVDSIISKREFTYLFSKYAKALDDSKYQPTTTQRKSFITVLQRVSELGIPNFIFHIKVSEDNELLLIKESSKGMQYISVGGEKDDISYILITEQPGKYYSLHLENGDASFDNLIDEFIR
jgi:hypothetical protein